MDQEKMLTFVDIDKENSMARERDSEKSLSEEVKVMSWDEFKDDIGSIWSFVKWTIIILIALAAGSCLIRSCIQEWKDIL